MPEVEQATPCRSAGGAFDRKEKNIVLPRASQRALTAAAFAPVLAYSVTLLATRGVIDALLTIVIVAVLAGMYLLRRYSRVVLLYRRPSMPPGDNPTANRSAACLWPGE
jgi:hypothetical protein